MSTFLSIFSGLVAVAKASPEVIKLLRDLWKAIESMADDISRKDRMRKLREGLNEAAKTKNTGPLEKVFNPNAQHLCASCGADRMSRSSEVAGKTLGG